MSKPKPSNLPQQAVALAYREGSVAPKVVAKGRGLLAEAIIERAREAGLYVHESSQLVALLMQVDLDSHIPPELYRAVAELLAFIHFLDGSTAADLPDFPLPPPPDSLPPVA